MGPVIGRSSEHFPGVDRLPPLVQELIERLFPPEELPMLGGAMVPPGQLGKAVIKPVFRGYGDMAKVLGPEAPGAASGVPAAPNSLGPLMEAIKAHSQNLSDVLLNRSR